jgi:uncharacterized protein YndB with AHSA1/START domain
MPSAGRVGLTAYGQKAAAWIGTYRRFWKESYGRLYDYLQELQTKEKTRGIKKLEIIAEPGAASFTSRRTVDAPRALVFDTFTNPECLKHWMGPRSLTLVNCESDLRVGGRYRFAYRNRDGLEFEFHGEYCKIIRPERIIRTFICSPLPEHEALETLTLEDKGMQITITTIAVRKDVVGRDKHLLAGGMAEGYARLDELLAALQAR